MFNDVKTEIKISSVLNELLSAKLDRYGVFLSILQSYNEHIRENCTQNAMYSILIEYISKSTSSHFLRLLIANALKYKLIFRIESHHHHHNDNNNNFHSIIVHVWELLLPHEEEKKKVEKWNENRWKIFFSSFLPSSSSPSFSTFNSLSINFHSVRWRRRWWQRNDNNKNRQQRVK